jgi:hypothetical protein
VSDKQKVLVAVLCSSERNGWVNPDLSLNLIQAARDTRFIVDFTLVRDLRPFEYARNAAVNTAMRSGADWLLQIDNDNYLPSAMSPLDVLAQANGERQNVIGLNYAHGSQSSGEYALFPDHGHGAPDGPFREVDRLASGVLFIHRSVWQKIPPPWFKWEIPNNPLLAPEKGSGEDMYFSALCRQHGLRIWTHQQLAGHFKTIDATSMVCTLSELNRRAAAAQRTPAPHPNNPWVIPPR